MYLGNSRALGRVWRADSEIAPGAPHGAGEYGVSGDMNRTT